ncbi:hypothetical protein [Burkholderia pseudomallei]|uniref:hypothetical protein n=1 Tax=Burkholderia pseudomallei TaxID=28450 RepID=UPI00050DABBD|nr:hypothetical protein [Burkholderia pseudomallei]KGD41512.1 hypothetical protein DP44_4576 [Burkholderia pseudomallei]KGR98277.1 putative membrane protein [Burkholderia pseudomallei MSHR5608]KGS29426.1 putative membrane protein [Burkholderia pseudomallei MSHR7343]KGS82010.1 putative membrane protein [Burkholderia pseudomallei MSHR7334]KGU90235.1 hypothetical protein X880_5711 [Burkholderia pseudomallei MSHR4032]
MKGIRLVTLAATGLFVLMSSVAHAAGGGHGGGMGGMGGAGGNAGGMSAGHMSRAGMTDTNGFDSGDRDKGIARASDRASTHANLADTQAGRTRSHATTHTTHQHHLGKHLAVGKAS